MTELSEKQRDSLDEDQFAFPKERKEPLNNASHVRNAIARFNQVEDVSDDERDAAWRRIKKAAKKYDVEINEDSWHDLKSKKEASGDPLRDGTDRGAGRSAILRGSVDHQLQRGAPDGAVDELLIGVVDVDLHSARPG